MGDVRAGLGLGSSGLESGHTASETRCNGTGASGSGRHWGNPLWAGERSLSLPLEATLGSGFWVLGSGFWVLGSRVPLDYKKKPRGISRRGELRSSTCRPGEPGKHGSRHAVLITANAGKDMCIAAKTSAENQLIHVRQGACYTTPPSKHASSSTHGSHGKRRAGSEMTPAPR